MKYKVGDKVRIKTITGNEVEKYICTIGNMVKYSNKVATIIESSHIDDCDDDIFYYLDIAIYSSSGNSYYYKWHKNWIEPINNWERIEV